MGNSTARIGESKRAVANPGGAALLRLPDLRLALLREKQRLSAAK